MITSARIARGWRGARGDTARRIADQLPRGRLLPDATWRRRHRIITGLLWLHVPALLLFGILRGYGVVHSMSEMLLVVSLATVASMPRIGRGGRSAAAALGLVACSALLIHFWDGQSEGHFHFFVVVSLLILYQDWLPFLIAIGFVVLHHGVLGSLMPHSVYAHGPAQESPWFWALIHGAFILAASAANVVSWRATEQLLRDPLTGLAGRAIMFDRLRVGLLRAHRRGSHAGVIFLDLDRFKVLNDSLGHAAGDRVLVTAGERLRDAVRAHDTAVRFGGDEFVIVCEDLHDVDEADRRRRAGSSPRCASPTSSTARRSCSPSRPASPSAAPATSAAPRSSSATPTPPCTAPRRTARTATSSSARRCAPARSPVWPTRSSCATRSPATSCACTTSRSSRSAAAACAPSRRTSTGSTRPAACSMPRDFRAIAEETGMVVPIGAWAIGEACAQLRRWREAGAATDVSVSINVSALQLSDPGFIPAVEHALEANGLVPSVLCLEIPEAAVVADPGRALGMIAQLRAVGVQVALDGYGTGHLSMSCLRQMGFDTLKLNRVYVRDLEQPGGDAILRGIIDMAHALNSDVTAKGVARGSQLRALRALGCDAAQGPLLAAPSDAGEIGRLVVSPRRAAGENGRRARAARRAERRRVARVRSASPRRRSSPRAGRAAASGGPRSARGAARGTAAG